MCFMDTLYPQTTWLNMALTLNMASASIMFIYAALCGKIKQSQISNNFNALASILILGGQKCDTKIIPSD